MEQLYINIKKFREMREMSQQELANKTGYTDRSSIAKIENGKVDLPKSKITEFARALNVSEEKLQGYTFSIEMEKEIEKYEMYQKMYGSPEMPDDEIEFYSCRDMVHYAADHLSIKNLKIASKFCEFLVNEEEGR